MRRKPGASTVVNLRQYRGRASVQSGGDSMEQSVPAQRASTQAFSCCAVVALMLLMSACDMRLPPDASRDNAADATASAATVAATASGASLAAGGGDANAGRQALVNFGCGSCHTIPGVRGADAMVGPPLNAWSRRSFIAGRLPNTPENLVHWIVTPQTVEPGTAMPNLGVSEREARDMAAYLYKLR